MASFENKQTIAYESDLRWCMVYQSCVQGLTLREIASNLNVDHSTVCRVLKIFEAMWKQVKAVEGLKP